MSLVDIVLDSVEGLDWISNFNHHYYFVLLIQIFTFVFNFFFISVLSLLYCSCHFGIIKFVFLLFDI
jgi:hypothetical protein